MKPLFFILTLFSAPFIAMATPGPSDACTSIIKSLNGAYEAEEKGPTETTRSYYLIIKTAFSTFKVYGVRENSNGSYELIQSDKTLNGDPITVKLIAKKLSLPSQPIELNSDEEEAVLYGTLKAPEVTYKTENKCTITGLGTTDYNAVITDVKLKKGNESKIKYAIVKTFETPSTTVFRRLSEERIDALKSNPEIRELIRSVKGSL